MNRGWVVILLLIVSSAMFSCVNVYKGVGHLLPGYEFPDTLDRDRCIAYLDTAALDDWEGVWLMIGSDQYCYLYIERINNNLEYSFYTHRILLWHPIQTHFFKIPPGLCVGYLEYGLYDDSKRIVLFDDNFFLHNIRVNGTVQLDETNSRMEFEESGKEKRSNMLGLRRIFPVRSVEERRYRVRYL